MKWMETVIQLMHQHGLNILDDEDAFNAFCLKPSLASAKFQKQYYVLSEPDKID
jgi:hypothetical protein